MGIMVVKMHINGALKVAYEEPSILNMGWAGEFFKTKTYNKFFL